jgi:hypothetical protein
MLTAPNAPRLEAAAAVESDAADVFAHLVNARVRFDARAKVVQAEDFTNGYGGSSLAVPSKLYGTASVQENVAAVAALHAVTGRRFRRLAVRVLDSADGPVVAVLDAETSRALGFVQRKHVGWLAPLFAFGAEVYASAFTGGEGEKFFGVNVVFVGVADAIRAMNRAADVEALEAMMEGAYASGDPSRVSAASHLLGIGEATYTPSEVAKPARRRDERGRFVRVAA